MDNLYSEDWKAKEKQYRTYMHINFWSAGLLLLVAAAWSYWRVGPGPIVLIVLSLSQNIPMGFLYRKRASDCRKLARLVGTNKEDENWTA